MSASKALRARILGSASPHEVRWLPDAVVVVDGDGRLEAVELYDGRPVDEDLRAEGLMTPGFVDAHLHFPQLRIIGAASGPLLPWLQRSVFPEEARFADEEHARIVAAELCDSLRSAGTTLSMIYGSAHPRASEVLLEALEAAGQRAIVGPVLMDRGAPEDVLLAAEPALEALETLAGTWHGRDGGRLRVAAVPRFALSCSPELLRGAGALAERLDLPVTTHLSENLEECRATSEAFGADDYLSVYEDAGLTRPGAVFAHCIHLSDGEWDRFAAAGCVVAHCPDSNDFLGSGGMPVARVATRQIGIALGSDVAAGRTLSMPHVASRAFDNGLRQGVRLPRELLLWWAARVAALALGEARVGALKPGLEADLVLWPLEGPLPTPERALERLLFDHDRGPARRVWVRGRELEAS